MWQSHHSAPTIFRYILIIGGALAAILVFVCNILSQPPVNFGETFFGMVWFFGAGAFGFGILFILPAVAFNYFMDVKPQRDLEKDLAKEKRGAEARAAESPRSAIERYKISLRKAAAKKK